MQIEKGAADEGGAVDEEGPVDLAVEQAPGVLS